MENNRSYTFPLEEYQKTYFPKYLDGRYFYKVLSQEDYLMVAPVPLIIKVNSSKKVTLENNNNFEIIKKYYQGTDKVKYIRLVIEYMLGDNIVTRHSNLLILDSLNTTLARIEPKVNNRHIKKHATHLDDFLYDLFDDIDDVYTDYLEVQENDTWCNAYVLRYAYFDSIGKEIPNTSDDIEQFARAVEELYGPLSPTELGGPDREYGDNTTTNTIAGGAIGAGLGLALGGPAGALVGGGAGALIGRGAGKHKK